METRYGDDTSALWDAVAKEQVFLWADYILACPPSVRLAHTLPPGHPGTEFAPAGVLDAVLECAAKKHLEVVTSRRNPNWFEADREALNKAIAFRNECSGQLFKRPKDAAVKAEFARARQVLRKAVRRARARFRVESIQSLNYIPNIVPAKLSK
jgi:hypothetical protein